MKFNPEFRNSLYFGHYRFGIRCYVPDANLLRCLDHDMIDEVISYRNSKAVTKWQKYHITESQAKNIHDLCDALLNTGVEYKKICHPDHLNLYSDDDSFLHGIAAHPGVLHCWAGEAQVTYPKGAVCHDKPTHGLRAYLKEGIVDDNKIQNLKNFFATYKERYRVSPAFAKVLRHSRRYIRSYYFIDILDQNDLLLLSLVSPELLRKTMPIVAK